MPVLRENRNELFDQPRRLVEEVRSALRARSGPITVGCSAVEFALLWAALEPHEGERVDLVL